MFARTVDLSDQCRQRYTLRLRDLFKVVQQGIFKADAGLGPPITTERLTIEDFIEISETPKPVIDYKADSELG